MTSKQNPGGHFFVDYPPPSLYQTAFLASSCSIYLMTDEIGRRTEWTEYQRLTIELLVPTRYFEVYAFDTTALDLEDIPVDLPPRSGYDVYGTLVDGRSVYIRRSGIAKACEKHVEVLCRLSDEDLIGYRKVVGEYFPRLTGISTTNEGHYLVTYPPRQLSRTSSVSFERLLTDVLPRTPHDKVLQVLLLLSGDLVRMVGAMHGVDVVAGNALAEGNIVVFDHGYRVAMVHVYDCEVVSRHDVDIFSTKTLEDVRSVLNLIHRMTLHTGIEDGSSRSATTLRYLNKISNPNDSRRPKLKHVEKCILDASERISR